MKVGRIKEEYVRMKHCGVCKLNRIKQNVCTFLYIHSVCILLSIFYYKGTHSPDAIPYRIEDIVFDIIIKDLQI